MNKTWYEQVKEDFTKNIKDTYTLNLAISILEDRKQLLDENLKNKELIEKYHYEHDNEFKYWLSIREEHRKLKEENERYRKLGFKYLNEQNEKLKKILDELEKWLEEESKLKGSETAYLYYGKVLNKIKKLRGREDE